MAFGIADRSLDNRERQRGRWSNPPGPRDHHADIQVIREQPTGLNGSLVPAIDQDDALARHIDEWKMRRGLGRGGEQRGHLRPRPGSFRGPTGCLAQVYEIDRLRPLARLVREQRNLLRAADRKRSVGPRGTAKLIEFGPAQVAKRGDLAVAASA